MPDEHKQLSMFSLNAAASDTAKKGGTRMKQKRKWQKAVTSSVIALAALSATGITALAAEGWVQEGETWYYYGNDGEYVYDQWKQSGNHYFYLGPDGSMLTNTLIYSDDGNYYYVDENGAMVTSKWVLVEDDVAGIDSESGYVWYYFGSNGRAYKNSSYDSGVTKKTIDGKTYVFDEEGHMLWGWIDEYGSMLNDSDDPFLYATYYLGDWNDGSMRISSWLEYQDITYATSNVDGVNYEDLEVLWFWFGSNGKLTRAEDDDIKTQSIGGVKYAFDQNGVMLSSWVDTLNSASGSSASESTAVPTPSDFMYFSEAYDGHLEKNTWIWAIPSEGISSDDFSNETFRWFYAGSTGSLYKNAVKTINGKKYAFDQNGIMRSQFVIMNDETGFVAQISAYDIERDDFLPGGTIAAYLEDEDSHLYYFSGDEETDGSMKTGSSISIELGDDTYSFGFKSTGKAYGEGSVEESSNKFYQNGLLLKASRDYMYGVVQIPADDEDDTDGYIYKTVNTSGAEISGSNRYLKDPDGNYLIILNNEYYAYVYGLDHSPVYYDGCYYEYDSEQEGNRGSLIEQDICGDELPDEMRLNF